MAVGREKVMERKRFSKEWINRRVLVALRNESRGTYAILGRLREVTDKDIRVVMRLFGRIRTLSRVFMAEAHLLNDQASRGRSVAPYSPNALKEGFPEGSWPFQLALGGCCDE
jgi:hypothetical protein